MCGGPSWDPLGSGPAGGSCPVLMSLGLWQPGGLGRGRGSGGSTGRGVQDFEGIWAAERPDAHTGPQRAKAKCTEALLFFSALALIGLAAVGSVPRGPVG